MAKMITNTAEDILRLVAEELQLEGDFDSVATAAEIGCPLDSILVPASALKIDWNDKDEHGRERYDPFVFPEWIDVLPCGLHLHEDKKHVALVVAIPDRGGRVMSYWLGQVVA